MSRTRGTAAEQSGDRRRELWITLGLAGVAVAAATIEYGRDMGVAVLAVLLGFAIHVRLFLGIIALIHRLRGAHPVRDLTICGGLCVAALLLHWLSPVPLRHVAALSVVIAVLVLLAKQALSRTGT
jgi:hypothetical protein